MVLPRVQSKAQKVKENTLYGFWLSLPGLAWGYSSV